MFQRGGKTVSHYSFFMLFSSDRFCPHSLAEASFSFLMTHYSLSISLNNFYHYIFDLFLFISPHSIRPFTRELYKEHCSSDFSIKARLWKLIGEHRLKKSFQLLTIFFSSLPCVHLAHCSSTVSCVHSQKAAVHF